MTDKARQEQSRRLDAINVTSLTNDMAAEGLKMENDQTSAQPVIVSCKAGRGWARSQPNCVLMCNSVSAKTRHGREIGGRTGSKNQMVAGAEPHNEAQKQHDAKTRPARPCENDMQSKCCWLRRGAVPLLLYSRPDSTWKPT